MVQAAMIAGVAAILSAWITTGYQKRQTPPDVEHIKTAIDVFADIEAQRKALVLRLRTLSEAYNKLANDERLTIEEKGYYKKLYEETKAELEKQKQFAEISTKRRRESEAALDSLWIVQKEILTHERDCLTKIKNLQVTIDSLSAEIVKLENKSLRRTPVINLSDEEVKAMITKRGYYHSYMNPTGSGINHQYEFKTIKGDIIVIDHATGLTWQQSGSSNCMSFNKAQNYIKGLNNQSFAGYNNWRLPTLEEAMSLVESKKNKGALKIDPVFDKKQLQIWTSDKNPNSLAWIVVFAHGKCIHDHVEYNFDVLAVR